MLRSGCSRRGPHPAHRGQTHAGHWRPGNQEWDREHWTHPGSNHSPLPATQPDDSQCLAALVLTGSISPFLVALGSLNSGPQGLYPLSHATQSFPAESFFKLGLLLFYPGPDLEHGALPTPPA
jgi:hypothetical protein